jgi:hypothetical protein
MPAPYLVQELDRTTIIADLIQSQESFAAGSRGDGHLNSRSDDKHDFASPLGEWYDRHTKGSLVLIEVDGLQRFSLM